MMITPIHTRVSGRARFRIDSGGRLPQASAWIEAQVLRVPGLYRASYRSLTRSLLVFFDPRIEWPALAERITEILKTASQGDRADNEAPGGSPLKISAAFTQRGTTAPPVSPRWHQLEVHRALKLVGTSRSQGLDPQTAHQRIHTQGANVIQESRLRGRAETLKDQFSLLPLGLLMVETAVALLGGAFIEGALLSIIVALNLSVGYLIDRQAEQAIVKLKRRRRPPALVLRGGSWMNVPGEQLVIGDILRLSPGTYVGADCRIISSRHLKLDESILTGESNPVDKDAEPIRRPAVPLFAQRNMVFMGTLVVGGEGIAVVVATGPLTEYGRLSALFTETLPPKTPLIEKIQDLSAKLLRLVLAIGFGILLMGLLRGQRLLPLTYRVLSVAASGMPAGLPVAASVNMAIGFRRLKRGNISIRRLYSLESLGAVQTICFDKTGTLTRSRINVQQIYCSGKRVSVHQRGFWLAEKTFRPLDYPDLGALFQACVLCSEAKLASDDPGVRLRFSGSPTEVALLHLAIMAGVDIRETQHRHPVHHVRHRGDAQRHMVTVHSAPNDNSLVLVKGDPSEVLEMCAWELREGRRKKLSPAVQNAIELHNQEMGASALRVLGFACRTGKMPVEEAAALCNMTWIGLVGMAEPIREGVAALMKQLHGAGIKTVMITGDQSTTAEAVARQIGLSRDTTYSIFDSSRIDALNPEVAAALIADVEVFARINPAQKLLIIQAYQKRGQVVAMTGDGINDGPALRAADVGIAMGLSGTDAAREVADMVLDRDNITSLNTAICEGRAAYRNLKRTLRYFVTTHFSDLLLVLGAATLPSGEALVGNRPVQVNLLTDLTPGLALLLEPSRPTIGREAPRNRQEPLFSSQDMLALLSESCVLSGGALATYVYGLLRYGPGSRSSTLAYETLFTSKLFHALTCRPWGASSSLGESAPANPVLNAALALALAAQAGTLLVPGLRRLLNIAPVGLLDLGLMGLTAWMTRGINLKLREKRRIEADEIPFKG